MQFNTRVQSVAALIALTATTTSTAWAGGRCRVVYVGSQPISRTVTSFQEYPQNRSAIASPSQQFRHDDALSELQSRTTSGGRGLQASTLSEIQNTLSRIEQRQSRSLNISPDTQNDRSLLVTRDFRKVRNRDFQSDRAIGVLAATEIAATVLQILKQFETSPAPSSGVQKADALVEALTPLIEKLSAQTQNASSPTQVTPDVAVDEVVADIQPVEKLAAALSAIQEALKEYKDDEVKQKQLREAALNALKKVAADLQEPITP